MTSNDNADRSGIGIDYITFDTFADLHDLLASDENFKGYQTVIISSQDAFEEELVRFFHLSHIIQ